MLITRTKQNLTKNIRLFQQKIKNKIQDTLKQH